MRLRGVRGISTWQTCHPAVRGLVAGVLLSGGLLACGNSEPAQNDLIAERPPDMQSDEKSTPRTPSPSGDPTVSRRLVSYSQHAGRRHLEMEVSSASLGEFLTLQVAFVNKNDASFALVEELGGEDFLLADEDGSFSSPRSFDDTLGRLGIDGTMGPGQVRRGQVVFQAPQGASFELRFADFTPVPLVLGKPASEKRGRPETDLIESGRPKTADAGSTERQDRTRTSATPPATTRSPSSAKTASRRRARNLQRVLDRQGSALEDYDLEAYLGTFAVGSREREKSFFHNVRSLPLASVSLRLLEDPASDPSRRVPVELRYELDGQPADNPFVHELQLSWQRGAKGLQVVALEDQGDRPVPWRTPGLVVHRSHHFLLATEEPLRDELIDLAADAEAAYASLYRQGLPLASGYFVHLVADRQLFGRLAGRSSALGVAIARHAIEGDQVVVNSRAFYVNGSVFARLGQGSVGADRRRTTVTHELVHLALAERTRVYTPVWLKEGAAVYFSDDLSYDRNRALVQQGLEGIDLERLTAAPVLGQHDLRGKRTADEYVYAGNIVAFLIEENGRQAFLDFYGSFADLTPVELAVLALGDDSISQMSWGSLAVGGGGAGAPLAAQLAPRQLQEYYGVDLQILDRQLNDWLHLKFR